jgi:Dyp-type peroxidase family
MPFPPTPLQPGQNSEVVRLLAEVQGNVLSSHRQDFSAHLFLRIAPGNEARVQQWLHGLAVGGRITSMTQQIEGTTPERPFLSVMVSYAGATKLGWGGNAAFRPDFKIGAHDREETLVLDPNDPQVAGADEWEPAFRPEMSGRIDLHLLLAGDDHAALLGHLAQVKTDALAAGAECCAEETGYVARNQENFAIEHFGFVDGISNPQYMADDVARALKYAPQRQYWDPLFPLDSVLVPVTHAEGASYGSFFVYRKIEQHVAAFKKFERRAREATRDDLVPDPAALIVGRTCAGRPLAVHRDDLPTTDGKFNDFTYGDDRRGRGCPFHAHIRKSNPRRLVPEDNDSARNHLFPRRGILYGERAPGFTDEPAGGVGLLFMAYMASIETQFEHVLRNWINNPKFPGHQKPGTDSLIGEPPPAWAHLPVSSKRDIPVKLERFVTTRAGEYFFVPPIPWFKALPC